MPITFEKMEKSMVPRKEKVSNKHIPDDLVFSILSKLPVKSLKRFGCVCKSWGRLFEFKNTGFMNMFRNNFISKDHYCHYHTYLLPKHPRPNHNDPYYLYLLSGEKFENKIKLDWPPPFQEVDRYIGILGSVVDGIFCFHHLNRIVLWNPSTEEFKIIPSSPSPIDSPPPDWHPVAHVIGFGYDHLRDDYKVIRHANFFMDTEDENDEEHSPSPAIYPFSEIYSLRSDSWRKLDVDIGHDATIDDDYVYLNGMCHWRAHPYGFSSETVVSFDLSNEVCLTTPIPSVMEDSPSEMEDGLEDCQLVLRHMVVLNESIAMISNYVKTNTFHVSILGELGVKESWVKLFIVGSFPCALHFIGAMNNGDMLFMKGNELVWCDLSTQKIEELGIKGNPTQTQIRFYKESLVFSPKSIYARAY